PVRIGTASAGGFVDSAPVVVLPKVTSFGAMSGVAGPQGPLVTANGSGFRPGGTVAFNGVAATPASTTNTKITVRPPLGATSGKLAVTNPNDPAGPASSSSFTVTLSVTNLSPSNPAPGAPVT